jgi:hypothetical protein
MRCFNEAVCFFSGVHWDSLVMVPQIMKSDFVLCRHFKVAYNPLKDLLKFSAKLNIVKLDDLIYLNCRNFQILFITVLWNLDFCWITDLFERKYIPPPL